MTKSLILLLAYTFIPALVLAGTRTDTVVLKVKYAATLKTTMEDKATSKDEHILLIGKNMSKYYSLWEEIREQVSDSLSAAGITGTEKAVMMHKNASIPQETETSTIYKGLTNKNTLTVTDVIFNKFGYIYEEPVPVVDWQLVECDTIIAGYECKKAVGRLRGRTWTAWYAIDLPYDNGPWKLQGLPGLILYAVESEHIFSFKCNGIESVNDVNDFSLDKRKYDKCTPKILQDEKTEFWKDQTGFITRKALGMNIESFKSETGFIPCFIEYY